MIGSPARPHGHVPTLAALALAAGLGVAACADTPVGPATVGTTSAGSGGSAALMQQSVEPIVPGQVLARFTPGANGRAVAASVGATIERDLVLGVKVLRAPTGRERAIAEALSRNPEVEFAEPNYIRTFGDPAVMPVTDPYVGYMWQLDNDGSIYNSVGGVLVATGAADADMDWREAVELMPSASGSVRVGIMDSGIRNDHEELAGRIVAQKNIVTGAANAEDDDGHGTHVAGTIGASTDNGLGVAGVAYAGTVEFVIAKVCAPIDLIFIILYGCDSADIAEGIKWAVDNGANVLNLSLGGGSGSTTVQSALQYARDHDVLPFCATGNDNGPVSYPAAWPQCVAVGATDWSDSRASYSNWGSTVALSAPGGDTEDPSGYSYILSSYNGGPSSYAFMAGTSMAAPQATGLAALLHVLGMADDDAKLQRMRETADDLGTAGWDPYFGAGRINVLAAITGVGGGDPPPDVPPTALFTYECDGLACTFDGSGSYDGDGGAIASYAWDHGDGTSGAGATSARTYAAAGSYTVVLTVTDDEGDTDTDSKTITVEEPVSSSIVIILADGYKVKGVQHADLAWIGAVSASVDIRRDGTVVETTPNDGIHTHVSSQKGGGSAVFQVCEAGTDACSAGVEVRF